MGGSRSLDAEARLPAEEALVGKRVRVREGSRRRPGLGVPVGTIEKLWGDPSYPALDVLLDDGTLRLFWHHDLEEDVEGGER